MHFVNYIGNNDLLGSKHDYVRPDTKIALLICKGCSILAFLFATALHLLYLVQPMSTRYLYSLIGSSQINPYYHFSQVYYYLAFLFFEIWTKSIGTIFFTFFLGRFLISVVFQTYAIRFLQNANNQPLFKKIKLYQCLYLLSNLSNKCYLPTIIPFLIIGWGSFNTLTTVALLRLYSTASLTELALLFQTWVVCNVTPFLFFHISGKIFKDSLSLKNTYKRAALVSISNSYLMKCNRKSSHSLQPFGVSAAPIKVLSYNSLAAFYIFVVNFTMSVLVGTKN